MLTGKVKVPIANGTMYMLIKHRMNQQVKPINFIQVGWRMACIPALGRLMQRIKSVRTVEYNLKGNRGEEEEEGIDRMAGELREQYYSGKREKHGPQRKQVSESAVRIPESILSLKRRQSQGAMKQAWQHSPAGHTVKVEGLYQHLARTATCQALQKKARLPEPKHDGG